MKNYLENGVLMKLRIFSYLLDNNPRKVISTTGIKVRKSVNWIFRHVMVPLSSKNRLHVERRASIPEGRKIIYAATHGFRDDAAYSLAATGRHSYVLVGALNIVLDSLWGLAFWFNGVILVDRFNKESRASTIDKIRYSLQKGTSVLMFPEATWNHSENQLVLKLFPGVYDAAVAEGALVVPVTTIQDNGKVYAIVDEPFDISVYEREKGLEVLRDKMATLKYELMEKYSRAKRSDIGDAKAYWKFFWDKLVDDARGLYVKEQEIKSAFIDKTVTTYEHAFEHLHEIKYNAKNAFLARKAGLHFPKKKNTE